jgi:predicted ArsR family transcriptional regulator
MTTGHCCPTCGRPFRPYKQRAYPVRDKLMAFLKANGPSNIHQIATHLGNQPNSVCGFMRTCEAAGLVERAGFEEFTFTQTINYGHVERRPQQVTMSHYRTLWKAKLPK